MELSGFYGICFDDRVWRISLFLLFRRYIHLKDQTSLDIPLFCDCVYGGTHSFLWERACVFNKEIIIDFWLLKEVDRSAFSTLRFNSAIELSDELTNRFHLSSFIIFCLVLENCCLKWNETLKKIPADF